MFGLKRVLVVAPFFVVCSRANAAEEDSMAAMMTEAMGEMDINQDGTLSLSRRFPRGRKRPGPSRSSRSSSIRQTRTATASWIRRR